ncbi:MAG: hypothetical protein Tsb008_20160 [Rhodothalassiaceae bacterium]
MTGARSGPAGLSGFPDEKSGRAFRTIGEVSEALDLPQHVLRFWETRFTQIRPMKRGGNRRYYRPEDIELLLAIKTLLYRDGLTIKGVQKRFREQGVRATVEEVLSPERKAPVFTPSEADGSDPAASGEPAERAGPDPRAPALIDILSELRSLRRLLD